MDDQTKPLNDFIQNFDGDSGQESKPLTSFLQSKQAVKTEERPVENGNGSAGSAMPSFGQVNGAVAAEGETAEKPAAMPVDVPTNGHLKSEAAVVVEESVSAEVGDIDSNADEVPVQPSAATEAPKPVVAASPDIDANKLNVALKALKQIEQQVVTVIKLLETGKGSDAVGALRTIGAVAPGLSAAAANAPSREDLATLKPIDGRVVEGVFDGRGMVGSDGKNYSVPPNYASKSKLVEGDMLKLTITPKGSFIYKQIGPIERSRLIGSLGYDQTLGEYYATSDNRRWNVLKASVTYFRGEAGDEVVLLVPKNAPSKWAAVENIIKRNPLV